MDVSEFESRILPACRTKHLFLTNSHGRKRRLFAKSPVNEQNKVPYFLRDAAVPRDFVRLDPWEMEYLFIIASRARIGIVETGRFNGGSALVMACANASVPIWSVDIAPQDDERLKRILAEVNVGQNVHLIVGDSQKAKYPEVGQIDLLYIDGDHSYDGCMNDLTNWYEKLAIGGHVVLHDCYFGGEGVQDAVLDFISDKSIELMVTPYKIRNHFRYPEGSICHFIRRG